jgi:hypothetical protein
MLIVLLITLCYIYRYAECHSVECQRVKGRGAEKTFLKLFLNLNGWFNIYDQPIMEISLLTI